MQGKHETKTQRAAKMTQKTAKRRNGAKTAKSANRLKDVYVALRGRIFFAFFYILRRLICCRRYLVTIDILGSNIEMKPPQRNRPIMLIFATVFKADFD